MSFTDQKPFVVTQELLVAFTRNRKRFNCKLCGHKFAIGDAARWVFTGGTSNIGNLMVCPKCDGPELLTRAKESFQQAVKLAQQWDIYGPDWQKDWQRPLGVE